MSKLRTGASLSKDDYWCVQYLTTVLKKNSSDIMNDALQTGLVKIGNNKRPKKPARPSSKDAHRFYYTIDRELLTRMTMLQIDRNLYNWGRIDIIRYGLRRVLWSYTMRYPELKRITHKYRKEVEDDQETDT